jgi:putative GTP pyrophosphokinase
MTDLKVAYQQRVATLLEPIREKLDVYLRDCLNGLPRIDRLSVRVKDVERFIAKAERLTDNGAPKYTDPINQIQDQIGARIVTFYRGDVEAVAKHIRDYFTEIEEKLIVPDNESEFGYFGQHFIMSLPRDVYASKELETDVRFFELQVKTLFQHAWGEANHDLAYKPTTPLSKEQKRLIAFTAAQGWGADHVFEQLVSELGVI